MRDLVDLHLGVSVLIVSGDDSSDLDGHGDAFLALWEGMEKLNKSMDEPWFDRFNESDILECIRSFFEGTVVYLIAAKPVRNTRLAQWSICP